ncbi:MAG TPA: hypothetical protein VFX49_12990 [Chloroflexota bacterium]|nr:hypothetical protein [Chloroflexota bacterium]
MADSDARNPSGGATEEPSEAARAAIAEELVLNAAVAFAGQAVSGAQQAAAKTGESLPPAMRELIVRQYWLETATLCLRRLGESYGLAVDDATQAEHADLLRDGARRADEARASVEAIGDLALDLLDRLLES